MNDLITSLYKYFAKFIPKAVLDKTFNQPSATRKTGYDELKAEVLNIPGKDIISDFDVFVISVNEDFVSGRIKNSKKFLLFVEYGEIEANRKEIKGIVQHLAVTVAHNFSNNNNDNLNEILLMNKCLEILYSIIDHMQNEQEGLDFCANAKLIQDPVHIKPVDPKNFEGCGGWCAIFTNAETDLL